MEARTELVTGDAALSGATLGAPGPRSRVITTLLAFFLTGALAVDEMRIFEFLRQRRFRSSFRGHLCDSCALSLRSVLCQCGRFTLRG